MSKALREIIAVLLEKTQKGKAIWNKSSGRGEYKLIMGNSAITINRPYRENNIDQAIVVSVYNKYGDPVDSVYMNAFENSQDFELAGSLYELIHQTETEKTYQAIFETIKSNETIGSSEINPEDLF